jgi:hypothetical protein
MPGTRAPKRLFLISALIATASIIVLRRVAIAGDQTMPGAGGGAAEALANKSPLIQSAMALILKSARQIRGANLRKATLDAISNQRSCVRHRENLSRTDKAQIIRSSSRRDWSILRMATRSRAASQRVSFRRCLMIRTTAAPARLFPPRSQRRLVASFTAIIHIPADWRHTKLLTC